MISGAYCIISKQHYPRCFSPYFVRILFIITANRNGLNADPWCSPTLTLKLSGVPTAQLTTVSLPSYICCTSCTYFPPFLIFSYSSTAIPVEPCRKLFLGLRIHKVALFDLSCTFSIKHS